MDDLQAYAESADTGSNTTYHGLFSNSIRGPHQRSVVSEGETIYHYPQSPTPHPEEISRQFLPLLSYDESVHEALPPSLSHPVRALIISYARAIASTSPALVITQEDIHIANCIQARMEQSASTVDGMPFADVDAEAWAMENPSLSPSPQSAAIDTPTIPDGTVACLYDGCDGYFQSLKNADIETHLRSRHFSGYSRDAWMGADDEKVVCRWPHCTQDRPILKRTLTHHIKDVHLREQRVACTNPGCTKSYSRYDAMVRHAKKCVLDLAIG
ncbi:uncharacterized protein B0H18DRAFT_998125 [Fomitopsis serialis]|uniref:uncharacterized protein n=1 Tax=Fomitopsis serialis TaxID=139415 RepID=UPI002007A686|nr:uncharacterized protein B0H18DRAFT_998125 [Neoantrodia serialis]KAH9929204.1 hypothetical protein B0H18DRAFT_998125 [Neoantrodia serialis]